MVASGCRIKLSALFGTHIFNPELLLKSADKIGMITEESSGGKIAQLDPAQIASRVKGCARLPSLSSVNNALQELLNADQRYSSQVAEVIRRDPSLTARLLRLVNSVYYGLSTPINSIEEAVSYLGVRQIRQLAMVTPTIEDFQKLTDRSHFPWREFWQHCIGTAILTREVIATVGPQTDEIDYVAGLVHDVGKIAMASSFPDHFSEIHSRKVPGLSLREIEMEILGIDHCELGAIYLQNHNLPDVLVETSRHHHQPEKAVNHQRIVAAVQIANLLMRHARIGCSGDTLEVTEDEWLNASGWDLLFPQNATDRSIARNTLVRSLDRVPTMLEGLV